MSENRCSDMISVVIPVYNTELYLSDCIASVLGQSYSNLELLLIDDGSVDHSAEICEEYAKKDQRVHVFHKENGGVSVARNMGIDNARGRYLIFVDADDQIHKDLLKIYMEMNTGNQVLLCGISSELSNLEKVYAPMEEEGQVFVWQKQDFMKLFDADYVHAPWNKLYDMEILRKQNLHFPEDLSLGEDLLFNLSYFQYAPGEYKIITCPLYYYQEGQVESLSNCFRLDLFDIQLQLFERLRQFLQTEKIWNQESQTVYHRIFWDRMYLTVQIYWSDIKKYRKPDTIAKMHTILCHGVWKELEQKCKEYHLIKGKRLLKKYHLFFLKNLIKAIDN